MSSLSRSPGRTRLLRLTGVAAAATVCVLGGAATVAGPALAADSTLFVAPQGSAGATDGSCASAAYSTITSAVSAAAAGDTVLVCPGIYHETVSITKTIQLVGKGATIDATGLTNGVLIDGAGADGSAVRGFTISHANHEGVLAEKVSQVSVADDKVLDNDVACQPQLTENDCGEGLHLRAVTNSTVAHNDVEGNTGGIHITDGVPAGSFGSFAFGYHSPAGPSYGNTITGNLVRDNLWDCGISLPSHNSDAVPNPLPRSPADTQVQGPAAGGVYDNTITNNVVTGNGTEGGGGSGILMAAPFPGTASYANVIAHNTITGNGQGGVTLHSHAPFQNLNDNQIVGNVIGQNNLIGDPDPGDSSYTGVMIFSAFTPLTGTLVAGNTIFDDYYGVYVDNAPATRIRGNHYSGVTIPVYTVS